MRLGLFAGLVVGTAAMPTNVQCNLLTKTSTDLMTTTRPVMGKVPAYDASLATASASEFSPGDSITITLGSGFSGMGLYHASSGSVSGSGFTAVRGCEMGHKMTRNRVNGLTWSATGSTEEQVTLSFAAASRYGEIKRKQIVLKRRAPEPKTCGECVAAGRSWQIGECNPTRQCLVADVGCFTDAQGCVQWQAEEEASQACPMADNCGDCASQALCGWDSAYGECFMNANFWALDDAVVSDKGQCPGIGCRWIRDVTTEELRMGEVPTDADGAMQASCAGNLFAYPIYTHPMNYYTAGFECCPASASAFGARAVRASDDGTEASLEGFSDLEGSVEAEGSAEGSQEFEVSAEGDEEDGAEIAIAGAPEIVIEEGSEESPGEGSEEAPELNLDGSEEG